MTYSRACGISTDDCCDFPCCCTHDRAAQPFAACDRPDCPICATRNALQTAHNQSREDC